MGLFDTVRAKAGELAADAERAGKVAAAQARGVTLQSELRKAERELGQTTFSLIELGEVRHPDLDAASAALRAAREALDENEREIAALRGETPSPGPGRPAGPGGDGDGPGPAPPAGETAGGEVPGDESAGGDGPRSAG